MYSIYIWAIYVIISVFVIRPLPHAAPTSPLSSSWPAVNSFVNGFNVGRALRLSSKWGQRCKNVY